MNKNKIALNLLAITLLLLFMQCRSNNDKKLHKELTKRAAELNTFTPVSLDEHTRFDSVGVSKNNVFKYYYSITNINDPHKLIALHKTEMLEAMDKMYTSDKSLQFFAINEVTMEYIYRDTHGNVIDVITIETEQYKMNKKQP